ncbi:MAG: glycoside-pentoside-hexuronide (GPH):cation symporter [Clostridiales bacterium]|nr:glycoside-pentoside-hexuronide (GPH):cation symporter [Clostridiales bacterium]MCD8383556.1 glycoside-pentoside-hexuronide (GPH):cation symporter [Clostridiales bacterium]
MNANKKVPLWRKTVYGLGTGGGNVFSQIGAAFLLSYYTDTALIGAAAIGTMFVVCRIFDGISDLIMGAIVDKTNTKWGKARPWLILSGPLTFLGIVLLMHVPESAGDTAKLIYAYATYIFMSVVVYTIFGIANTAMLPLMTRDRDDNTMLATFSAVGNSVIGLIAGSSITPLVLAFGWHWASIILGAIAGVLILISGLVNKEIQPEEGEAAQVQGEQPSLKQQFPAVMKNRYFWLLLLIGIFSLLMNANAIAAQSYYASYVIGDAMFMSTLMTAGQAPGIIILFLMPAISKRWSKRAYLTMGAVLLIIGFLICGFAGTNTTLVVIGVVIRALGAGPLLSAVFAFVPDVVEYGYWKYGVRSEGLISSAQSIGSKIGMGFGSAMCAWILAAVGYSATLETQSEAVISAIQFDYTFVGAIIGVIILVLVLLTDVEKYAPQFREANAQKDQAPANK